MKAAQHDTLLCRLRFHIQLAFRFAWLMILAKRRAVLHNLN
jgi:hypothetical protein